MSEELRIIFMGTPDFAVESLKQLVEQGFNVVGVVTAPDKPAGRGQKIRMSAVKKYALEQNLNILQPSNLKSESFINQLQALNANLQIVVAFRMLPEVIWSMPKHGTFNLHASLLPNYRGAAPINWAIINGEKETGVTTFKLQHKIDTGDILFNEKTVINENDTAGDLHDKLMYIGGKLIIKTVNAIANNNYKLTEQTETGIINEAPKIFKQDCKINWENDALTIHNFIRGLSPYPTAYTTFANKKTNKQIDCKIFIACKQVCTHNYQIKSIIIENNLLKIAVVDGFIVVKELQLSGKKRMKTSDFIRGFDINKYKLL